MNGTYEHFVYADSEQVIRAVRNQAEQADFLASEPAERGGTWSLQVYGSLANRPAEREQIRAICAEHGAEYDGGGVYLGSLSDLADDE